MSATRPSVLAAIEGDTLACGRCQHVFGFGIAAVRTGAQIKCPHCGIWNDVPVPPVARARAQG